MRAWCSFMANRIRWSVRFCRRTNPILSGGVTALLVAPGSEPLCRVASPPEQELWMRLSGPAVAAALIEEGATREVIESMLHIGALEYP